MLLGMVDAGVATMDQSTIGHEYRQISHIRIVALFGHGYFAITVDDKHPDENLDYHVNANISDARRLGLKLIAKCGQLNTFCLGHVFLDYFFPPVSESFWC